jgi:hypothetical protein
MRTIARRHALLGGIMLIAAPAVAGTAALAKEPVDFSVMIESVTGTDTLVLPDGTTIRAPISPGLYVVSPKKWLVFHTGDAASGTPLERLAEDGNPAPLIEALGKDGHAAARFVHDEVFTVTARPGDRLHFAVMFAQSNDVFLAPRASGIELFDREGRPFSGNATGTMVLWDAGTEVNQPPGAGADQAPRQGAPNIGAEENGVIHVLSDGLRYPAIDEVIRVTITPQMPLRSSQR